MSQEQIIIEVDDSGATKIEVKGHAGPGCKELTAQIEKALGEVSEDVKTNEYHQRAAQTQKASR